MNSAAGLALLFALGLYHGLNPAMGWLFAVALGMQEKSRRAVWKAIPPIALGHGLAILAAVAVAWLVGVIVPLWMLQATVGAVLIGLGLYRLKRNRHPRWASMQVGFRDLTVWSFLMASAHGAGLMVLPLVIGSESASSAHSGHLTMLGSGRTAAAFAVLVHTLGYLLATCALAALVYEKLGLSLLRHSWINLDLIWSAALLVTGAICAALAFL